MLDEEMQAEIQQQLPQEIPHIFISSVTGQNIMALKDKIWSALNEEL
jgi:GTP-binding protein